MENLMAIQIARFDLLKRFIENFKRDPLDRRTASYYKKRLQDFQNLFDKIQETHTQILVAKGSEPDKSALLEHTYLKDDLYSEMEEFFYKNYPLIEERFERDFPSSKIVSTSKEDKVAIGVEQKSGHNNLIKLPKIALEKFSGDYRKWTTFHDLFQSLIHNNANLSRVQKLQYLKLHLGGEAENLLRHVQVTDDNYESAWTLLNDRYDNKRVLVNAQLKLLLSQNSLSSETAQGMKSLLDITNESLQALNNLSIDTTTWDAFIVYIIVQKLPTETHQLWEQGISKDKDIPSWARLKEFLESRFRTLEAVSQKKISSFKDSRIIPPRSKFSPQSFHLSDKATCILCSHSHNLRQCQKFSSLPSHQKLDFVKSKGLCINCLGQGHIIANCPSQQRCNHCRQRHHTLLHRRSTDRSNAFNSELKAPNRTVSSANEHQMQALTTSMPSTSNSNLQANLSPSASSFVPQRESTASCNLNSLLVDASSQRAQTLLATALVKLRSPAGRENTFRALIDQGSQVSLVTESVVQSLKLKRECIRANVTGIGQTHAGQVNTKVHLTLKSLYHDDFSVDMDALVLTKLTHFLPTREILRKDWEHIQGLKLADPLYHRPSKVDILLGADVFGQIILKGLIHGYPGTPVAQETVFGWILCGKVEESIAPVKINSFHITSELQQQIRQFWELEEINVERPLTKEEQQCEEHFQRTHKRRTDGRYEVELPFSEENTSNLGLSRGIALSRLYQMERRFKINPTLKAQYAACLNEYSSLGHMEPTNSTEEEHRIENDKNTSYSCCYLPHHSVMKEDSTTTKLRVVFNASAPTSNGVSLNQILLNGPTQQDELASILLRWRRYKIAFTADVEKMYRQILVTKPHADYQRIVWRESAEAPVKDYKLLTVTFGTKSAAYLATRVIKQLANDERDKFPLASAATLTDFYVDDLMSGAPNVESALEKQAQFLNLMKTGGFSLRKWVSNSATFLEHLPKELREIDLPFHVNVHENVKALGMYWNPQNDTFSYTIKSKADLTNITKRSILSEVSKLFDPLGWLSPIIIIAKIMIQRLWLAKIDWDEPVPGELSSEWVNYQQEITKVDQIFIPRWINLSNSSGGIEIHGFCDASTQAYAAVVYICSMQYGQRKISMLTAKTKVAPIKTVSLPRLELCGAVLLAKLVKYVKQALKFYENVPTYAWTDSEIVIAWLRGHPTKWKTFIANRVSLIHDYLEEAIWRHVPSKQNPADCATRGLLPDELRNHTLWWQGPEWLQRPQNLWPPCKNPATQIEMRNLEACYTQVIVENEIIERFSSLTKLIKVVAYCKRFIANSRKPGKDKRKGHLKNTELQDALRILLRDVQRKSFSDEIENLKKARDISRNSRLLKLTPFLDKDGILRVGGRLRHSNLSFSEKHPIILPDKSNFTRLFIDRTHRETLHGGPQLMMSVIAWKYWLLNARNVIRQQIHKCIPCFKQKATTRQQLMGDLPIARVRMSRPFSHTGVDYCGPFELRNHRGRGAKKYKGYIAIFVCMATKAMHLELVTDLSAQGFIAAYRRFVSRRGPCSDVYCDCGSNFVGANRILTRQSHQMVSGINAEIAANLETEGVNFHFIPPASPHFGGLWESGVRSTKYHLKRILRESTCTYEELSTVLAQIEACLNSRPICEMSSDPNDLTPLTPAHFLIGDVLLTPPEPSLLDINVHRLDRWQYLQRVYQSFWKRWNTEYLCRLQQRPKWTKKSENIKVGDLVLIKEDNLPPSRWMLGRITEVYPGSDQLVRVVTIKTKDSILKRPITKVCLLPIENNLDQSRETHLEVGTQNRDNN